MPRAFLYIICFLSSRISKGEPRGGIRRKRRRVYRYGTKPQAKKSENSDESVKEVYADVLCRTLSSGRQCLRFHDTNAKRTMHRDALLSMRFYRLPENRISPSRFFRLQNRVQFRFLKLVWTEYFIRLIYFYFSARSSAKPAAPQIPASFPRLATAISTGANSAPPKIPPSTSLFNLFTNSSFSAHIPPPNTIASG